MGKKRKKNEVREGETPKAKEREKKQGKNRM